MEKILITGTGRCGSTFLMKIFSFLGFHTGYNRENYMYFIPPGQKEGLEKTHRQEYYISKNPQFLTYLNDILNDEKIIIKQVLLIVRDFESSAKSRYKNGNKVGGLWKATDVETQVRFYEKIISNYIYVMTKHEINTTFINFDRMVNDKKYLFFKIKDILDEKNIDFDTFSKVYDEAELTSKPNYTPVDPNPPEPRSVEPSNSLSATNST